MSRTGSTTEVSNRATPSYGVTTIRIKMEMVGNNDDDHHGGGEGGCGVAAQV